MKELMPFILTLIFVFGVLIAPFLFINWLWRRKYRDKNTGWKKCGMCGKVADPIVVEEGFGMPKYFCKEHCTYNQEKKKKDVRDENKVR